MRLSIQRRRTPPAVETFPATIHWAAPGRFRRARASSLATTKREQDVQQMRTIKSDIPAGMTLPEYRKWVNPSKRHSAVRRFVSFGLLR
jgi:hypothetical protein